MATPLDKRCYDRYMNYRKDLNFGYDFIDNDGICVYCGEQATTEDHIMPLYVAYMTGDIGIITKSKVLLPACQECNALAGTKIFNKFTERKKYIQLRIKQRNKKLLSTKGWTIDELSQLGNTLRQFIENSIHLQSNVKKRIQWQNRDNPAYALIAKLDLKLVKIGKNSVL